MEQSIPLRDGSRTKDRRLDRLIEFDERSRNFPVTAGIEDRPLRSYSWNKKVWLDQGVEGACVEFSLCHELAARPAVIDEVVVRAITGSHGFYWPAQRSDQWEGGSYPGASPFYEGTSVIAGTKVAVDLGYYDEYRWAFGEHDLALAVGYRGPAVLGIPWYEGMFEPDENGYVWPTGSLAGYHAILDPSFNVGHINPDGTRGRHRLDNSWGKPWGIDGSCWVTREVMARLLSELGEAMIPTIRNRPEAT